jgi:hypothetical protein
MHTIAVVSTAASRDRRSCTVELSGVTAAQRSSGTAPVSADVPLPHRRLRWICARLRRADLTQIQNMTLHHPAALKALVLDDAPIAARPAVLLWPGLPQEHDRASLAKRIRPGERGRSSLQPFSAVEVQYSRGITYAYQTVFRLKSGFSRSNPRRRANKPGPNAKNSRNLGVIDIIDIDLPTFSSGGRR